MSRLHDLLDTVTEYVVITQADDGTLSAVGVFNGELAATLWANDHETDESGITCHVRELESPQE